MLPLRPASIFALTLALAWPAGIQAQQPAPTLATASGRAFQAGILPPRPAGPSTPATEGPTRSQPKPANAYGITWLQHLAAPLAEKVGRLVPLWGEGMGEGLMLAAWTGDFLLDPAHFWVLGLALLGTCLGLRALFGKGEAPSRRKP